AILNLAETTKTEGWAAFIVPVTTRAKTGATKPSSAGGIAATRIYVPEVLVGSVGITASGQMVGYGFFPRNTFARMSGAVLDPIDPEGRQPEEVVAAAEAKIRKKIKAR